MELLQRVHVLILSYNMAKQLVCLQTHNNSHLDNNYTRICKKIRNMKGHIEGSTTTKNLTVYVPC